MTFEEKIHEMFDSIWDCEIDHPIFQDTVGELMEIVIDVYNDMHGNFVYVGNVLDLVNETNASGGFANYNAYSTLFDGVDSLNTYASGIIHCKDCKLYIQPEQGKVYGRCTYPRDSIPKKQIDFCSCAKRRE